MCSVKLNRVRLYSRCIAGAEDTVYKPYKVLMEHVCENGKTVKGEETGAHERVITAGDT